MWSKNNKLPRKKKPPEEFSGYTTLAEAESSDKTSALRVFGSPGNETDGGVIGLFVNAVFVSLETSFDTL